MNMFRRVDSGLSMQDERDIGAVMIAYATGIDCRDWALFRTCFTEDCLCDYGNFGSWNNAAALTEFMRQAHAKLGPTLHRITNIRLSAVQGGANAVSYIDALLTPMNQQGPVNRGIGSYEDFFVRTGAGWKIARRNFKAMILE